MFFILDNTLQEHHRRDPVVLNFIVAYINCRDVGQACKEVSIERKVGNALRKRHDIANAIVKITDHEIMKYGLDSHEIVEKVKEIAFVDVADLENADGTYKTSLKSIPPETRRAIKKFKVKNIYGLDTNGIPTVTGQLIDVEMWDKMRALDALGSEKKLFKETKVVEHGVTENMKDLLLESKERAEQAAIEARKDIIDVTPEEK